MGISARYYRMSDDAAKQFLADESVRLNVLWDEGEATSIEYALLDLDKDWDALKLALGQHSTKYSGDSSLRYVFEGGTSTEIECTYGFIRLISHQQVQRIAEAFETVSDESVRERLVVTEFRSAEVYPNGSSWDQESVDLVWYHFQETKAFFRDANSRGDVVFAGLW